MRREQIRIEFLYRRLQFIIWLRTSRDKLQSRKWWTVQLGYLLYLIIKPFRR